MSVGSRVTERSPPTDMVPPEAHPNSSEISVDLPLLPNEYLWTSRHGGASDPSSFDVTDRNVSVQTWRFPDVVQLVAVLKNDEPFGDVSAATGPAARRSTIEPPRIANLNRRIRHLRPWRRAGQRGIALHPVVNGDPMPRTSRWRLGVGRFGSRRGSRRGRNSAVRDGETDLSAVLLRQREPDLDHLLE